MVNSLPIFAGLDANKMLRFVGDVARGAACGCHCVTCGAALIARRGEVRTWHFAHEANQERPECFAGAVNLLRRLAIERLRTTGVPPLPLFLATARTVFPLPLLTETVVWTPGKYTVSAWMPDPPQDEIVALLRLSTGSEVCLFVTVGENGSRFFALETGLSGINFEVPLPLSSEDIKDYASALDYIDRNGKMSWIRCPDANQLIATTQQGLNIKAQRMLDDAAAVAAQVKPAFQPKLFSSVPLPVFLPPIAGKKPELDVDESPWASWRKPRHAFLFYGLKDGSAWVLFPHQDGRYVMAPYPEPFDGWDEAIPTHVGTADQDLGCYVIQNQVKALMFLGSISKMIQTPSNWSELQQLSWP